MRKGSFEVEDDQTFSSSEKRNQLRRKYPNSSALVPSRHGKNARLEPAVEQVSDTVAVVDFGPEEDEDGEEPAERPDISVR